MKDDSRVPIDILKGLAIICVILLHSWDKPFLLQIGAPYYISQAVSIFIIVAAYNGVNSYARVNATTLAECLNNMPRRLKRLILPYCVVFIIECFIIIFVKSNAELLASITSKPLIAFFFIATGGYGPGSFFIPVLIPLIFILPILYILARKNMNVVLVVTFILNLAFEFYTIKSGMSDWICRILFLDNRNFYK
jgi:peptidoglycan/LPS O-acetylase OafA/YrhL